MSTKGNESMRQIAGTCLRIMSTIVVCGTVIWFCLTILSYCQKFQANHHMAEGVAKLEEISHRDVAKVEQAIRDQQAAAESDSVGVITKEQPLSAKQTDETKGDMKSRFSTSVVMGDSITKALEDYNLLNGTSVVAKNGINLKHVEPELEQAVALNPEHIFLSYGMNDLEYLWGDPEKFESLYEQVIQTLREQLPDTKIYINSVLPIQQKAIEKKPLYGNVDAYNEALKDLCGRLDVTFIDNGFLMEQEDIYQEDGIHPRVPYYSQWLEHMAEKAGL